jgi:hypothetical protein
MFYARSLGIWNKDKLSINITISTAPLSSINKTLVSGKMELSCSAVSALGVRPRKLSNVFKGQSSDG